MHITIDGKLLIIDYIVVSMDKASKYKEAIARPKDAHWKDFEETFSPLAKMNSIVILISIASFYDYEVWNILVKTTYLNNKLTRMCLWNNLRVS